MVTAHHARRSPGRRPRTMAARAAALWLTVVSGLSAAAEPAVPRLSEHPLAGRVWDAQAQAYIEPAEAERRALGADYLLLGEVHVNAEHHRLQAHLLAAVIAAGERPAVVFEQFDLGDQAALEAARRDAPGDADALAKAVDFAARGWDWDFYRPLVAAALAADLPIVAANLSRADARRIMQEGGGAVLGAGRWQALGLATPLPAELRADLVARIEEAHCGHAPERMLDGMVAAQRARDALMAEALLGSARAVLIAGAGHVRRDYAVPYYLAARAPGASTLAVAFTEVQASATDPQAYVERGPDGRPLYDLYWFTPRYEPEDPCAAFAMGLERMRQGGGD